MSLALKPTHATVKAYYDTLGHFGQLHIDHEMAVRSAFQDLLAKSGRKVKPPLTLVPEYRIERARGSSVVVDGALVDLYHLPHGYWEAKDEKDDLAREVQRKLDKGYPRDNIIFQAPERAILYQGGARIIDESIKEPEALVSVVNSFFDYKAPHIQEWEQAVGEFSERIPELAAAVKKIIDEERRRNPAFVHSFEDFYALCRQAINPNLSEEAVERMLIQHLLTERIFERIFDNPDFTRRNVVAAEIEKVIVELTKRAFNRNEFLRPLDRFYKAIEVSAANTSGFSEKQAFLNKVYERFFQGYSPKEADTHGIVYTPQPIVNFMVRSVEEILQKEFGRSLSDKGVHILDPFVGTGNFIVRIMQEIKTTDLPYKYENELHCNEVMLLPYYIASMNIEHKYFERVGEYKAFPGICLVDTFELAEPEQSSLGFMTAENAERVVRQKQAPIFVIVGNPPYNARQVNENDNNRNRKYPHLDKRISETYGAASRASTVNKSRDPFVRAFRWASDRIGDEGIVALVTNNSYLDQVASDGIRLHLAQEFTAIYILNLGGNIRHNSKISGTTHNVFGIKLGVAIALLVRRKHARAPGAANIYYAAVADHFRREARLDWLTQRQSALSSTVWQELALDDPHEWFTKGRQPEYDGFIAIADKKTKAGKPPSAIFKLFSLGANTNRDLWVYDSDPQSLRLKVTKFISTYNTELHRWVALGRPKKLDEFLVNDPKLIQWSSRLKECLVAEKSSSFSPSHLRRALYRPFTARLLYFDEILTHRRGRLPEFFPNAQSEAENRIICVGGYGRKAFAALATDRIPDINLYSDPAQSVPFYTYTEDSTNARENITDWALEQFRVRYGDHSITKWDIFHYIYAVLHHPEYRQRYAANLRRELPRIPFASVSSVPSAAKDFEVFISLAKAGHHLAEIHVHYERQPEYKLAKVEKKGEKLDYRVTKMRLSKDKTSLIYNQFLTLSGIPPETYDYRLGNRSALEWVIDQYQVFTDQRSAITNDPNRDEDPQYILRLIGEVITVSLETVKIVSSLPSLGLQQV